MKNIIKKIQNVPEDIYRGWAKTLDARATIIMEECKITKIEAINVIIAFDAAIAKGVSPL